jgi:pilus assembly protein CpaF
MSLQRRIGNKPQEEAKPADPAQRLNDPLAAPAAPPAAAAPVAQSGGYTIPDKKRMPSKLAALRKQIRPKLLGAIDEADEWKRQNPEHQKIIVDRLNLYLQRANISLSREEYDQLREGLLDDLIGYGAIEPLVQDKACSEIMVNGPDVIFAEMKGKLKESQFVFDDDDHADWVAQRIVRRLMRFFNRENPMTDARLPDGSRVHLIRKPSAIQGTVITIRKFPEKVLTVEDLIKFGSFPREVAEFLQACILARLNIVVSGGTGSGKTTLLNVLSSFIPEDERIVTIEDAAELQLSQRHVVRLETAPPIPGVKDGTGQLVIRDLVRGSLRMRPDRIVIGECRGGEALDMLQAMNTGHDGSLTTVHANTPRDAIGRLETLVMMSGMDLPLFVVRRQIAGAVNLFVQQARLKDGTRKVTQITEIQGMEGENVTLQDIFVYRTSDNKGPNPSTQGGGVLQPTGFRPKFVERFEQMGIRLSARIFGAGGQFAAPPGGG